MAADSQCDCAPGAFESVYVLVSNMQCGLMSSALLFILVMQLAESSQQDLMSRLLVAMSPCQHSLVPALLPVLLAIQMKGGSLA